MIDEECKKIKNALSEKKRKKKKEKKKERKKDDNKRLCVIL